jgi:virulence factor Mce-like protein
MRGLARSGRARRREGRSNGAIVLSALVVTALLGGFIVLTVRAPRDVPLLGHRTVTASLPDVGNLRVHSEVRAHGVRLGEVISIRPDSGRALVRLKLDPGTGDLPADTTASVRGKGLLGARFIQLEPGRSRRPLAQDMIIREARNPITLTLADALETFDAETRGGLRQTLRGMGRGLLGRGEELNDALAVAPEAFSDLTAVAAEVESRPGAAARLFPALDRLALPVSEARDDIARGFSPTARALAPFGDRRAAVRRGLDEAPPALSAATDGLHTGRALLNSARSLALAVDQTLPGAPAALRATTRLLRDAPQPLRRARALLADLRPAVPAVLRVTDALSPTLRPLRSTLEDLLPIVQTLGDHACDLVDFGENMRSVLNQGIASGGQIGPLTSLRFTVIGSQESGSNFGPKVPKLTPKFPPPCIYSVPEHSYEATG